MRTVPHGMKHTFGVSRMTPKALNVSYNSFSSISGSKLPMNRLAPMSRFFEFEAACVPEAEGAPITHSSCCSYICYPYQFNAPHSLTRTTFPHPYHIPSPVPHSLTRTTFPHPYIVYIALTLFTRTGFPYSLIIFMILIA